jgi:hypothetical protein
MHRIRVAVALGAVFTALSLPAATAAFEDPADTHSRLELPARVGEKHPKLDSALARLADATQARGRLVQVEAVARGGRRAELEAAIRTVGGTTSGRYGALVEARLPVRALETLAAHPAARRLRSPARPYPQVVGEGVAATRADLWHSAETKGAGVEIAIVDVGFAGRQAAQAAGELPEEVAAANFCDDVPFEGAGADDHGTAIAEIVHEVAPAARLHLVCIDTLTSLGEAKDYAVANDIPIVNHSIGWLNTSRGDGTGGPGTPDAIVADARAQGVLWVNSAGNYGQEAHWSGTFSDPDSDDLHNFAATDNANDVSLLEDGCVYLKWDDWPGSNQDFDLYLFRASDGAQVTQSENPQTGLQEPIESVCASEEDDYFFAVKSFGATETPRFDVLVTDGGALLYSVAAGSLVEPASSPAALTAGAVCVHTGTLEPYSSRGPTIGGETKPDVAGPDANSTVTYGPSSDCDSGFGGTSAAAAHVTAAAALLKQANPSFGPDQLQEALESHTGLPDSPEKNNDVGAGSLGLGNPPPIPPPAPANAGSPTISGLFHQGQSLTAGDGEWTSGGTLFFAFRWLRCDAGGNACVAIAGARDRTYVPTAADVGQVLQVRVTASNTGGSTQALSAGTPQIQTPIQPPANVIAPSLAGVAQFGQTLSASSGGWSGTAPLTITIEWLRCDSAGTGCVVIPGASTPSHLLGLGDIGMTVRIRVTASNPGGAASLTTAPSAVVAPLALSIVSPPPPLPTESPTPNVSPPPAPPGSTSIQTRLVMLDFTRSPQIPRAGRKFTLVLRVGTRTVSALRATRRVSCYAKLGRTTLRPTKSLRRGVARCAWAIPKTAAGKRLRSAIVVSEGKRSVRRTVAAKIRRPRLR